MKSSHVYRLLCAQGCLRSLLWAAKASLLFLVQALWTAQGRSFSTLRVVDRGLCLSASRIAHRAAALQAPGSRGCLGFSFLLWCFGVARLQAVSHARTMAEAEGRRAHAFREAFNATAGEVTCSVSQKVGSHSAKMLQVWSKQLDTRRLPPRAQEFEECFADVPKKTMPCMYDGWVQVREKWRSFLACSQRGANGHPALFSGHGHGEGAHGGALPSIAAQVRRPGLFLTWCLVSQAEMKDIAAETGLVRALNRLDAQCDEKGITEFGVAAPATRCVQMPTEPRWPAHVP